MVAAIDRDDDVILITHQLQEAVNPGRLEKGDVAAGCITDRVDIADRLHARCQPFERTSFGLFISDNLDIRR